MPKKGEIREWFSKIIHGNENPHEYSLVYREISNYIEISFTEFLVKQQEDHIPLHRISQIKQKGKVVYTRPNFCSNCGYPKDSKNHSCKFIESFANKRSE
ncbi:RNA repair domain-containing protein [Candidatus Hodarchaeum mangrovi]